MLKKVRKAWSEFFRGTYVVPFKTCAKHPVCLMIHMIVWTLPSILYLWMAWREEKEIEKSILKRHTYKPFYTKSEDK